ncbi:pyruvate synthase subunit beta [bacterium]|nr:pyruvate synthase subunit beta [bacterium]
MKYSIPTEEYITSGTVACQGCGAVLALRYALKALGGDTVLTMPACCWSVIDGPFPYSATLVPLFHTAFETVAAAASGIRNGFAIRGNDHTTVVAWAGDGGTVDIGIQALSGAVERDEDFIYVCYDNEAYMNTGIQRSGSTPMFAATSSTPVGSVWKGKPQRRKNMLMIMAAHRIPYIATASLAYIPDLKRKIKKAAEVTRNGEGLAYLHVHQPCPTGWYFDPAKTVEVGRLAVQTGAFPLVEVDHGEFKISVKPKELKPVKEYLEPQRRFRHITEEQLEILQTYTNGDWEALLKMEKDGRLPWY